MTASKRDIRVNGKRTIVVRAGDLLIDAAYQRVLDEKRARSIGANLDERLFGFPVVSRRHDGRLYVIDGQHRVRGLQLTGQESKLVAVEVFDGLSVEDESILFDYLNGGGAGSRKGVRAVDRYRARLMYHDEVATKIHSIARAEGLSVKHVPGPRTVAAVQRMESIHRRRGNLAETLHVARAWADGAGHDQTAYDNNVLRYISEFLHEFPSATPDVLADQLVRNWKPQQLLAKVKTESYSYKETRCGVAVMVLLETYNKRNRNKLRRDDRRGAAEEAA